MRDAGTGIVDRINAGRHGRSFIEIPFDGLGLAHKGALDDLVRAGIVKPDDFLKTLSGWVESYRNRPGSGIQSLAESSFDAWIKFNKSTPDSVNSTVSFYDKGAMVSLLMDMHTRRQLPRGQS